MLSNFSLERVLLSVRNNNGTNFAATLYDAEHWSLVLAASPGNAALAFCNVHIASLAADEGFVRFDVTAGLLNRSAVERHAYSVIHEPCRLLSNAEIPSDLAGANAILAIHHEP